jgi:heme A synthase
VNATELTFAAIIFCAMVALALYFGRQQIQTLRRLRDANDIPPDDIHYLRRQARFRIVGCVLLVVLGAQVAGAYVFGLEARVRDLGEQIDSQRRAGVEVQLNEDQQRLRQFYGIYWIAALIVLLVIVFLAAYDIWAIRRYGRRHRQKIDAERRAMLEGQVLRFRSQRNGHT